MILLDKFLWRFYRRPQLKKSHSWVDAGAVVDKNTTLAGYNKINNGAVIRDSKIGKFTYVSNVAITGADIGAFCSIGPEVLIGLSEHPTNWISTHPAFYSLGMQAGKTFAKSELFEHWSRPIIGNDVWIGARAVILGGVKVGNGAIIATGAVVTKDVAPYSIVGGVPAKVIGSRFSQDIIDKLQQWCWWSLPNEVLEQLAVEFTNRSQWSLESIELIEAKSAEFKAKFMSQSKS
jgi:acetyltransferase-like isoleucine patch superfamily enzyme